MAADGKLQALTARGQLVQGILVSLPPHKLGSGTSSDTRLLGGTSGDPRRRGAEVRFSSGGSSGGGSSSSSSRHAHLM